MRLGVPSGPQQQQKLRFVTSSALSNEQISRDPRSSSVSHTAACRPRRLSSSRCEVGAFHLQETTKSWCIPLA